ncbi:FecR domain-containing protein [Pseudomonas xantholysinigenes]|uniref:FecR family protein n=1 Tax=Pseudomonas xantholysinigenes TaxID=2745490 RepID=A0A9E6PY80_9PSED|nr:FecR family protein [Pseudomonas xantholysinigenes]QXI39050.1 FecR family protein [Pseudomonas xantholysinigenes]
MTDQPIAQAVLAQAAAWLLLLQEGPLTPAQRAELERWRNADPQHERAWKRAQRLLVRLGGLPPTLARHTLERTGGNSRRAVLRGLAVLLAVAPLGWWLSRRGEYRADYQTNVGERRDVLLVDGSQVSLNSATALALRFDAKQRLLHLEQGEIYIVTAPDPQAPARPLRVQTEQGIMQALGTRFSVRQLPRETLLTVHEGAVQVQGAQPTVVQAGQQVRFSQARVGPPEPASEGQLAWRNGLLLAQDMPLWQWIQELMRHTDQAVACEPSLADLPVSGTYPLDDLPLALAMLAQTYRVRMRHEGRHVLISP